MGAPIDTIAYTYGDSDWGDLLTAYDGNTITYDTIGNPLTDGTQTYTWKHGRQLATMSDGTTTWTYTYNADGLRTKKTNGTETYHYVYNGGQLKQMTKGNDTLYFAYNANGTPMAVTRNSSTYYYVTNIQGDIIALVNTVGTVVVSYNYDAWGNLLSCNGAMASTLGVLNPLRYRSYVYDTETGFYYLQSRYYDPVKGRFISPDNVEFLGADGSPLSYNLFAYCKNNPVNCIDSEGNFTFSALVGAAVGGAIAGTIIGVVSHIVSSGLHGSNLTLSGVLGAAATGAVTGAIGAVGGAVGGVAAIVSSIAVGTISGVTTAIKTEGPVGQKITAGLSAGVVSTVGTYFGAKIPVPLDNGMVSGVSSFAGGLFAGTNTEIVNVVTQEAVSCAFSRAPAQKRPLGSFVMGTNMLIC